MATQFTGANAEIWFKTEKKNGVLRATVADDGQTTLGEAAVPGATEIKVASVANLAAGNIIAVGSEDNQEIVKIKTVTVAQKKITLADGTPLNFRHASGEKAGKTDPTKDWFALGGVTNFVPRTDRPRENSQALGSGVRAIANTVAGRYEFGADITVELDIETVPLWFLHALNSNYTTTGTPTSPEVLTKLRAAADAGAERLPIASLVNLAAGDFIEIDGKEVVKIEAVVNESKSVTFSESNPLGLRYAHATGAAVKKVKTPFTHTIVKGRTLPVGISLLLRLVEKGQESLVLLTGNRINTLSLSAAGTTQIPTLTLNTLAARGQVLSENIFGEAKKTPHRPYAQWEAEVSAGDAENRFDSLSLEIQNNVTAGSPFGSALPGAISAGEGSVSGSFEYEYRTQSFALATVIGSKKRLAFDWRYIRDPDYALKIEIPKAEFGGPAHPGVQNKDRIPDTKNFTASLDSASNTDIKIVAETKNPSVEYLVG